MSEEEKKKKTPDDLLKAGVNLPALYLQAKTNINELQTPAPEDVNSGSKGEGSHHPKRE